MRGGVKYNPYGVLVQCGVRPADGTAAARIDICTLHGRSRRTAPRSQSSLRYCHHQVFSFDIKKYYLQFSCSRVVKVANRYWLFRSISLLYSNTKWL